METGILKNSLIGIRKLLLLSYLGFMSIQTSLSQSTGAVIIPGTKCSIAPPKDFVTTSNFPGFIHEATQSSIMLTEMPSPVQNIIGGFTAEALQSKGMSVLNREEFQFQNKDALMLKVNQDAYGSVFQKHILLFGDSSNSILVTATYPIINMELSEPLYQSILSTRYDETIVDDPLGSVNFSIDVTGSDFQFTDNVAGTLMYSIEGKAPTERPYFILAHSISNVRTDNQKQYVVDRFKKFPKSENFVMNGIAPLKVDGLKGYELTAYTKEHLPSELFYQVMLFDDRDGYYIMIGSAKEELPSNLETFRKLIWTFKEK